MESTLHFLPLGGRCCEPPSHGPEDSYLETSSPSVILVILMTSRYQYIPPFQKSHNASDVYASREFGKLDILATGARPLI